MVDFVADTVNFVADTVAFIADTVDFVADTVAFIADTVDFVADTVAFIADTVNFVAGFKFDSLSRLTLSPTRSTLSSECQTSFRSPVCTGPKQHGQLSTKSNVLNSISSPVSTRLNKHKNNHRQPITTSKAM